MRGRALFVFTMQLLSAQTQPRLPAAIQNSFRFSPPASGPVNVLAAGFDAAGNLYLAGYGNVWPSTTTFLSPTPGEANFYVMKISGPSTPTPQVAYVTAIGPDGPDGGGPVAMAVDPAGNVYLAGYTGAEDFPTTPGSFQTSSATGGGFLLKLDPSGKKLVYSTFFAYPETVINALAVDASGNAYVAGQTSSATFPTTPGAFQSTPPQSTAEGFSVGFVSELDPTGATLLYSTFIGGPTSDVVTEVNAIVVDDAGAIRMLGEFGTEGQGNFPFTANAAYSSGPGFFIILSKTSPNLLYSTPGPLGGSELQIDGSGNSYIGGFLKINSNGTIGYYVPTIRALSLLVLSDGTAVVGGSTAVASSPTRNTLMPCVPNLPQTSASATFSGSLYGSATLTTIDPSGNLTFSTLLSAPGGNTAIGALAMDQNGAPWVIGLVENQQSTAYVTGPTEGAQFPGGPIIDASSGTQFAFMLASSAVPQGLPAPSCLASGAYSTTAPAAAGAITTLFGSNLGPATGVSYQLDANGLVPNQLDGTMLTVGGVPAPILYAQDTQINFVVPQQTSGPTTNVCVTRSGVQSCISAFTAPEWPAIFCIGACNNGFRAVLNQDGTLNSSSNPASAGSVLQIFGTGMGPFDRSFPDGALVQPPLANLANPASAVFYSPYPPCDPGPCTAPTPFPATVLFAGAAPLEVVGVDQVNVLIPEAAVAGHAVTLTLTVGNGTASANVYLK
jgi:uncharacterized protein (TIGR03437 family)